MLDALRDHNFALLWCAGLISLLGDWAMLAALPFFVYQQTGSTLATAATSASYYVPMLLLGSIAGVFVDRWDRKCILVVANYLQCLIVLPLLLVRTSEWLWIVYLVLLAEISVSMFFRPAESALLPRLVNENQLLSANALGALNNNIARLAGPPIGGMLLAVIGLPSVAVFDSISFLVAALLITGISVKDNQPEVVEGTRVPAAALSTWASMWREWASGLGLLRRDRTLGALFIVASVMGFGGSMFDPLIAPWVSSVLHRGSSTMGWLLTSMGVGGILGGLFVGRIGRRLTPARTFGLGNVIGGGLFLVMFNLTAVPAVLVLSFLAGIPFVGSPVGLQTLLQTNVPDEYRGRVFGAFNTSGGLISLASMVVVGALGDTTGATLLLSAACAITMLAGVLGLLFLRNGHRPSALRGQPRMDVKGMP